MFDVKKKDNISTQCTDMLGWRNKH